MIHPAANKDIRLRDGGAGRRQNVGNIRHGSGDGLHLDAASQPMQTGSKTAVAGNMTVTD